MKAEEIDYVSINDEDKQEWRLSDLALSLYFDLFKNILWTYTAEDEQSEGQQILAPFLGMLAGLLLLILAQSLAKCIWGSQKSVKEIALTSVQRACVPIVIATVTIPVWNNVVDLATEQCLKRGLTASKAGYIAGLFPGWIEGPLQQMIITAGNLGKNTEREALRQNSRKYLLNFGKDMLLSVVPGFIPGNVWQLVYHACKTNKVSPFLAIISVSCSVGSSNLTCEIIKKLIKPKADEVKLSASRCLWMNELLWEKEAQMSPCATSSILS